MSFICDIPKDVCNLRGPDGVCPLPARCEKVIDKCLENGGCVKIENGYCKAYIRPSVKWLGTSPCPLASNVEIKITGISKKIRAGQQKQKKIRG
jgi:hypothetical protein